MITVGKLAELLKGSVVGDTSLPVFGISSVEDAESGCVVVAENLAYMNRAVESDASVVVTPLDVDGGDKAVIRVDDSKRAFMQMLDLFKTDEPEAEGIHPGSHTGSDFQNGENITVGFGAYIGDGVKAGDNVRIMPCAYIGDDVTIGSDVVIHPNVTIYPGTEIGSRVIIHSGTVIGADGFGYVFHNGEHRKVPQLGRVVIEDDVEIGACSTIDRAKIGITRIGRGTKIDNLVHVAHNCKIGQKSLLVAQAGVAGSVQIGDGVVLAGQSGVKDHVEIGSNSIVTARAGVIGNVAPGSKVSGFPARDHKEYLMAQAVFFRLPELLRTVKELEAKLADLEMQVSRNGDEGGTDE